MIREWLLARLLPKHEVDAHTHCPDCGVEVPIQARIVDWQPVLEIDTTDVQVHILTHEESP